MVSPITTPRQRMLNAYRGLPCDRPPVAPELWNYYPARLLGVDMIEFQRRIPFHLALKHAFEHFGCEGWGPIRAAVPNSHVEARTRETWRDAETLHVQTRYTTPHGELTSSQLFHRREPSWRGEAPLKNLARDLSAWEELTFGGDPADIDFGAVQRALDEVGESYLLEFGLGSPFFDTFAGSRAGGFETGVMDFLNDDLRPTLLRLRERHVERLERIIEAVARHTTMESFCMGCSWSCNSLLGPALWRQWDKPVLAAVAKAAHRHSKCLHVHFHGRCMETVPDFAEIGIDCVCPFERPPGGDVDGIEGLRTVARLLDGQTTMNGNVHTVETLIRGTPEDVRREVRQILTAFAGNPRLIVGTGDQVGGETPEEYLHAMIDEVRRRGIRPQDK
jgi:hypothetical protein